MYSLPPPPLRRRLKRTRPSLRAASWAVVVWAVAAALAVVVARPAEAAAPGDRCWLVSDATDRLMRWDFDTSTLVNIGANGATAIEGIALDPVTQILYAADAGQLGTINRTTGAFTAVGPNFGFDLDGLAIHPFTGRLYVTNRTSAAGVYDDLAVIDLTTFALTFIGPISGAVDGTGNPLYDIDDLGFNPVDGRLYAATSNGGDATLVRLSANVGSVEATIGEFGVQDMEGLDFDPYGNLRGTTGDGGGTVSNSLFDVSLTTGVATRLTTFTTGGDYEAIACDNASSSGFNTITGTVFFDDDVNGVFGGADVGTPGHIVRLYRDRNGDGVLTAADDVTGDGLLTLDDARASVTTAADGTYSFTPRATGAFVVQIEPTSLPSGATLTTPSTCTANFGVSFGLTDPANDFGYTAPGELDIVKVSDVVGEADPGDLVTYTITVTNDGTFRQNNVTVTDAVPPGTTWVSTNVATHVPSGVFSTASDNFSTSTYSGGTGWLGPWTESGDGANPTTDGLIRIVNDAGSPALQVGRNTDPPTLANIVRGVNLSNTSSATLTFTKRDSSLETGENVTVEIFNGSAWSTLVVYQGGDPNDASPVPQSFDITPYASPTTQIRIRPPADTNDNNDVMFFDNFVVTWEGRTTTTQPGHPMPNLVTTADGYDLFPNEVMEVTVVVRVTDPMAYGLRSIDNTARANSDDQLGDSIASVTDPVNLGSIGDTVFLDADGDGVADSGEGLANLTVRLTGADAAGNPVALTTTTDSAGRYGFVDLPRGTYTITVDGTDPDFPPDVAQTVGTNPQTVALATGEDRTTVDFGYRRLGSIGDTVFVDIDRDGVADPGEGIPNVTVNLTGTDELGNPVSRTTSTDASGRYSFASLLAGTYTVTVDRTDPDFPPSLVQVVGTDPQVVALATDQDRTDVDFGYDSVLASLAGRVYSDLDNDGVFDAGETGIAGTTVTLTGVDRFGLAVSRTTTTDASGAWSFTGLRPANGAGYTVTESQPAGFIDGIDRAGSLGGVVGADVISAIPVTAGSAGVQYDFGELRTASLAGRVYVDADNDGVFDVAEAPIAGVTVTLTGVDDLGAVVSRTTTTDGAGAYTFGNLRPGTYSVAEAQPVAFLDGIDSVGSLGGTLGPDAVSNIVVGSGASGVGYDFGEVQATSLSGAVYLDADNDALFDAGESGIAGVTITLTGTDDLGASVTRVTTTAGGGGWTFTNLRPGTYTVTETQPSGLLDGRDAVGTTGGALGPDRVTGIVLASGQAGTGYLFGEIPPASLAGSVFVDTDGDGTFDAGETGIPGVQVLLSGTDDLGATVTATTLTGPSGSYAFTNLRPGTYSVTEVQPISYLDGLDRVGTLGGTLAPDAVTGIAVAPGATGTDYTFGEIAPAPSVEVRKQIDGDDADTAPGPALPAGTPVTWTYVVTNTGNVGLSDVTVTDDVEGPVCVIATLAAGASTSCTLSGTVPVGAYVNTGSVSGTPTVGDPTPVTDSDVAHLFGGDPSIDVEKLIDGDDADTAPGPVLPVGSPVTWTYVVTNTGNIDLVDGAVADDREGLVCLFPTLAVGATLTCTLDGTVGSGPYLNTGIAAATPAAGDPTTVVDRDEAHLFGGAPAVDIEKLVGADDADTAPGPVLPAGGPVTWTYEVTNSGNLDLVDVVVTDDVEGPVCTIPALAVGATDTCTLTGTVAAGAYVNTGTATATPAAGDPTPVTDTDVAHLFGGAAAVDIEKLVDGVDADAAPGPALLVGGPVVWTYEVTNSGNLDLVDVVVTDDVEGPVCTIPALAVGATDTCTLTGTVAAGAYVNTGTATATPAAGDPTPVTDTDVAHLFGTAAAVELEKRAEGQDADVAPGPYLTVGDAVTWTYEVTNSGNVDLTDVTVTDDVEGPVCVIATLAVGATDSCTLVGTVAAGPYVNTGSVSGTPATGPPVPVTDTDVAHYFGTDPSVVVEKLVDGQDADVAPGPYLSVGDAVTWTYEVTNTGNVDLVDVTVTDDVEGPVCVIATLAVGATDSCSVGGTVVAGPYVNTGSVSAIPAQGDPTPVVDSDPANHFGATPSIVVEKLVDGQDADVAPGLYLSVGDAVTWTYEVTNSGNVALVDVTVTDDVEGSVCVIATLAVGATDSCTLTGTVAAGPYVNTGSVSATPAQGDPTPVSDTDVAHHYGADPSVVVEKLVEGVDADVAPGPALTVGDPVTWTYEVTNTGNVDLTDVTVTDDVEGPVCVIATLAVGATDSCTLTGTVVAGPYVNTGSVSATPAQGDPTPVNDTDVAHHFGTGAGVTLEKLVEGADADAAPGPYLTVGDAVTWTYEVTNTGNVDLTDVTVTDDVEGPVCVIATLAVGATDSCTVGGTVVAGPYVNTGTVSATPAQGDPTPVTDTDVAHHYGADPSVAVDKLVDGQDADVAPGPYLTVGDAVTWTYEVTTTGNVDLVDVTVTDDVEGPVCTIATLAVGATESCTLTGTVVAGPYVNVGTANATPAVGDPTPVTSTDSAHAFGVAPSVDLEKLVNGDDADAAPGPVLQVGDAITWTYEVTNTGNVDLVDVTVTDDVEGPVCVIATLAIGATETCTLSGTAVAGPYRNTGTASATSALGDPAPVTDADAANHVVADPAVVLQKLVNGDDADVAPGPTLLVGDTVTWTYEVTNAGNVDLVDIAVSDDVEGPVCTIPTLAAGASTSCTLTGTVSLGAYVNTGTASATPALGNPTPVTDGDEAHHVGVPVPTAGVTIEKYTNTVDAAGDADTPAGAVIVPAGDPVSWIYVVTNTGNTALTGVTVTDDIEGAITCPSSTLAPGASMTCTLTGTAPVGAYTNVGSVTATSTVAPVSDSDPSNLFGVAPGVDLQKLVDAVDADAAPGPTLAVGDPVTWTYVVTNTGNTPLTNVDVTDDVEGPVCTIANLPVGGDATCDLTGTVTAGPYVNTGSVSAIPATGDPAPVTASDAAHHVGVAMVLGDRVFADSNDNGMRDPGEPGIAGVAVRLYRDTDANGVPDTPGTPVATTLTDGDGLYRFDLVSPGSYVIQLDAPAGYRSSTDAPTSATPDNDVNDDDNGVGTGAGTLTSGTVTLTAGGEPTGDGDTDPSTNLTLDAGLFAPSATIDVEKYTNGADADTGTGPALVPGAAVTWTYVVTNTGNVPAAAVSVSDDIEGAVACPQSTLAPGASMTCTLTGTAVEGQYRNLATVSATAEVAPGATGTITDTDASAYVGTGASISVVKRTNGVDADVPTGADDTGNPVVALGSTLTWTYEVTNNGDAPLSDVTVTDDVEGPVACPQTALAVGESMTCTLTGTATVPGQYTNVGVASGTDVTTDPSTPIVVSASNPSNAFVADPSVAIDKRVNGDDADAAPGPDLGIGTVVTWSYVVTNTGNVPLAGLSVVDDVEGPAACPSTTLAPGASMTCTLTGVVVEGAYVNQGVVTGTSAAGPAQAVTASDLAHHTGVAARIGDRVFEDLDGDGLQDPGEPGLAGVTVRLLDLGGAVLETTVTDAAGVYLFDGLAAGSYRIEVVPPAGYHVTGRDLGGDDALDSDADASGLTAVRALAAGEDDASVDVGLWLPASLSGLVFRDLDGDGRQDAGEPGVAGVTVQLLDGGLNAIDANTTSADGSYRFDDLEPGTYTVQFLTPEGRKLTLANVGDDVGDSDADRVTGRTAAVTLASGQEVGAIDAGLLVPATIEGTVFEDLDRDGIQDAGEPGMAGVRVDLVDAEGTVLATTTTGVDGGFAFRDLDPGVYGLRFTAPAGSGLTLADSGGDDDLDSDADPTTGSTGLVTVDQGDRITNLDAGVLTPVDGEPPAPPAPTPTPLPRTGTDPAGSLQLALALLGLGLGLTTTARQRRRRLG